MLKFAKKNDKKDICEFHLHSNDDLTIFDDNTFHFIYSNIVLQHMEPKYAKNYIREFIRILKPNGLLIFQLPSEQVSFKLKLFIKQIIPNTIFKTYLQIRYKDKPVMEMYGIKREELVKFLEGNKAIIIDIIEDNNAGENWISFTYFVTK